MKTQSTKSKNKDQIDTDNDGKLRQRGDTSDHGDPKSPYSQQTQKGRGGKEKIDTDNDGKLRERGDTSDHGDLRSPYGKGHQSNKKTSDVKSK